MDGLPKWDEQVSPLFVLPLGLPLIVNIVWHWMHCYQASKVSHLMGTIHTSWNYYSKLPASSLVYSGFLFPRLFLQQQRLEMLDLILCQRELCPGCLCWGTLGHSTGSWKATPAGTPQLWLQARSQPLTLMCLSFRTTVKHFYQPESHEFPYPAFHYENL